MKDKKLIACIIIIILSICAIAYNFLNKPEPRRARPASLAPAATVYQITTGSVPVYIETVATLIPHQSIILKSKVSGQIEYLASEFETGAIVGKDTLLLKIDQRDYANEVKKLEATLEKTKANYTLELGLQTVVQEELKQLENIMGSNTLTDDASVNAIHTELTLRKPQLEQVLADLAIAQANLEQAKDDLEDTQIEAFFDAFILSRAVSVGQHISANETLAELVSTEKYLADVAIPIDTLYNNQLLNYKNKDIPIEVITNYGEKWQGKLEQVVSALTTGSRMGKIIISIEDPLARDKNNSKVPLLLGDQVNVRILAGVYDNVIKVPHYAVHNNENIWLVKSDNSLQSLPIEVVWSDGTNVYIKNTQLQDKALVLHSGLTNPVNDLVIRPTILNLSEEEIAQLEKEQVKQQVQDAPQEFRNKGNMPEGNREGRSRARGESGNRPNQEESEAQGSRQRQSRAPRSEEG